MSDRDRQHPDLGDRLTDLAGMAGRAARQPAAPAIRRRGHRRVLGQRSAIAALAVVVLTAGAVSAKFVAPTHPPELPGGSPTPAPTSTADRSPDPTATSASPAQPPRSSGTPATPSGCRRPAVVVSTGGQNAGSGHRSVVLVFTNAGNEPCRLTGYPGVAGLDAGGRQLAQARRTPGGYLGGLASGKPVPVVTLAPGDAASALVEALAFNASGGSACTAFGGLLVTVTVDTASTQVTWSHD